MLDLDKMLRLMLDKKASDLFITAGLPPSIKIDGVIHPVTKEALSPEKARESVLAAMNEAQRKEFLLKHECNFAISARGVGRFRVSAFYQRNLVGMVLRRIQTEIPTVEELCLPPILNELSMQKRGLIMFVGGTGTGKSTSLAAMIGYRNRNGNGHIISIEDPIEFLHPHRGCIVTQREVGIDTESFNVALRNTLRQAPDVIMVGEVRTPETMEHSVTFADTGHLCLATLHANNANQAFGRIINFFPAERHSQIWMDLSLNLKAIVAQQLIPKKDGQGRQVIVEVLINTPVMADHIRKGEIHLLKEIMARSNETGMQTFDQALFKEFKAGNITYEAALAHADSTNDLRLMIKLDSDTYLEETMESANNLSLDDDYHR